MLDLRTRIPDEERAHAENLIAGHAREFGMTPGYWLRKVWYHQQAAVLGEFVALLLKDELEFLAPDIDLKALDNPEGVADDR